jgi:hypothetical protein
METASIDMHDVHSSQGTDGVRPWKIATHVTAAPSTSLVFDVQPPAAPTSETVDASGTLRRKSWG